MHGPLTRILLMDAARQHTPERVPARLDVRAIAPVLVDRPLRLVGHTAPDGIRVTAVDADDVVLATADITWA